MRVSVLILVGLFLLWRIIVVLGHPETSRRITIPEYDNENAWSQFQQKPQHSVGMHLNASNHDSHVISPLFSPFHNGNITDLGRPKRSTSGSVSKAKPSGPRSASASTALTLSRTNAGSIAKNPMEASRHGTRPAKTQSRQHSSASRPRSLATSSSGTRMQHGEARFANSMRGHRKKMPIGGGKSRTGSKSRLSPTGTAARGARRGAKTGVAQRAVGRRAGAGLSKNSGRRANTGRLPAQRKPGLLRGLKERLQRRRPRKPAKSRAANKRQFKNPAASRKNRKTQKKVPIGRKPNRMYTPSRRRTSPSRPSRPRKLANFASRMGQKLSRGVRSLRNRGSAALQGMRNRITNKKKPLSKKSLKKQPTRTKSTPRGVPNRLRTLGNGIKSAGSRLVSAGKSKLVIKSKPSTGQAKHPSSSAAKKKPSPFARTKAGIKSWGKNLKNKFKRSPKKSPSPGSSSKNMKTSVAGKGSKGQQKGFNAGGNNNNNKNGHIPKSVSARAADKIKGRAEQGKNNIKQPLMCKM